MVDRAQPAAFERIDLQLGREAGPEEAGLHEDVQLVRPPRPHQAERQLLQRIDVGERHLGRLDARDRHHLVGELREPEPLREALELALQLRLVEDLVVQVQVHMQPQLLEGAAAEEDDLVEAAFVDLHHDLLALDVRADGGERVARPVQEATQPGGHRERGRRRRLGVRGQVEHGAVDVLHQRDVSAEDEQRLSGGRRRDQQRADHHGRRGRAKGGRERRGITKRNPDQISSMAQTLLSTRPVASPISRTSFAERSAATPEDFFGHATQRPPAGCSDFASRAKERRSSAALLLKRTMTSASPRARGTTPRLRANPGGARRMRTRDPSLIPSFCGSGVPE